MPARERLVKLLRLGDRVPRKRGPIPRRSSARDADRRRVAVVSARDGCARVCGCVRYSEMYGVEEVGEERSVEGLLLFTGGLWEKYVADAEFILLN